MRYLPFALLCCATTCFGQEPSSSLIAEPPRPTLFEKLKHEKAWLTLSGFSYATSLTDANLTLKNVHYGHELTKLYGPNGCGPTATELCSSYEVNPLYKPLLDLPKPAVYSVAVGEVTIANWLSWKMKHSSRWYRHVWWIPQGMEIGSGIWGIAYTKSHSKCFGLIRGSC